MPEPSATPATLTQSTERVYFIERFYALVAGASDDRIGLALRDDLQTDALHAAYVVEAWLEEIQGREEKYDRLAGLARQVTPITDLLRNLSKGAFTGLFANLIASYETKHLNSILAQRYEFRQSAGEADPNELSALDDDPLTALLAIVSQPDGRDDYVAWFQIGWLYWKRNVLDEAENAFRTAASFSQRQSPWYFAQSLRHEAFMQWKRGNFERSRATARRAIEVRRDPMMLVEAARYSVACGQHLESQALLDEALHNDPFVFVSVLSDSAFAEAITSTIDILVRQQTRTSEIARNERQEWEDAISLLRLAEKQGELQLLPADADDQFAAAAVPTEPDYPTAAYLVELAQTLRSEWTKAATQLVDDDVACRTQAHEEAEANYRTAEQSVQSRLNSVDTEQRIAELVIQDEHDSVELPLVPALKDEMMNGLMIGLGILVVGLAILAALSQWRFSSIPPLTPVPLGDLILISPLLFVMVAFGLLGFITFPLLRLHKANIVFNDAARVADFDADQKLRVIANDSTKQRESIRQEWFTKKDELQAAVDEAQKRLRHAMAAHAIVKRIPTSKNSLTH